MNFIMIFLPFVFIYTCSLADASCLYGYQQVGDLCYHISDGTKSKMSEAKTYCEAW